MATKKITNVQDLTNDLTQSYQELKSGALSHEKAKEVSRMAGRILNSAKTQLEYNMFMKQRRKINFLDVK